MRTELLTTAEVADTFRVSQATVRRWAQVGRLAPVPTPGNVLRFRKSDVDSFLDSVGPVPEMDGAA